MQVAREKGRDEKGKYNNSEKKTTRYCDGQGRNRGGCCRRGGKGEGAVEHERGTSGFRLARITEE